jgi:tripartite-type tricarboxylate transporter receptor subunit TctC
MLKLVRCRARLCAIVCAALGLAASAPAQTPSSYPDRPIRLVVAFPPGGATDTLARQITPELGEALGQSVVIENKPGAGGYIAWNYVAASDPDGYTLLMAENALGISQALYKKSSSPFDPLTQYDAIAGVATSPLVLAVANNVRAGTVAELIAYSRTLPQKMNYASAGIGSVSHLTFEVIKAATGMEAVHVPYKGGGPAMNDVIAGHVALNMASIQVAKGLVETGKIKGLAVTSSARSPVLPNVPTLEEAGVKTVGVDLRFWFGIFGPKGIPDAVKAKLDKAVSTTLSDPRVRERLAKLDIEPAYAPGDALKIKLANEIANWTKFVDTHGIKPE